MPENSKFNQLVRAMNRHSTIILVGFMGSGKTTFGKQLAQNLNYSFIDTDQAIEELIEMDIKTIFKTKGELYFRELEHRFIEKIKVSNTVISTGGGMPCFYDNMEQLNQIGITVYLKYSPEELFERLAKDYDKRPLIANISKGELYQYIKDTLKEREPFYLKAHYIY